MKKIIRFSKFFLPAAILSAILVIVGIFGFFYNDGFALGVDFQAGLMQEIQVVDTALNLRWSGITDAVVQYDRNNIFIVISGVGVDTRTYHFPFSEYTTASAIKTAMEEALEYLEVTVAPGKENVNTEWFVFSLLGDRFLNPETPFAVFYHDPAGDIIDISRIRDAMYGFPSGVSVQNLGAPSDRLFMVRVEDREEGRVTSAEVLGFLEDEFGEGSIAIHRADYVGSRFSRDLTDQAGILITLTLLLILLYSAFRFKFQYAVGAVIAIMYDVIIIVAFVVWTRMEFTTLTIAAILTILGYSTNNTIIFFDRIRENVRIYPDHSFIDILDISLTGILGRTIITTASTMLAVLALFIFTTGAMQDFALALMVGMISGVYTTLFLVSGVVNLWQKQRLKREKRKLAAA